MSKTTILIVEDEVIVAADLANKLSQLGYEVSGSTTRGEEAIDLARDLQPDLVLMDIRLAGAMDGVEAAKHIRQENDLPVIYLTAHSDHATLQRAKLSEPFGYILKPFEKSELETHIEMALYKHQAERKLRESEKRYRLLFDRNPDGVFAMDANGRFLVANPACETIAGYPLAELMEMTFMELCAPDQLPRMVEHFEDSLRTLTSKQLETALIHKDGRRVEVWVAGEPIVSDGKRVIVHCTAKDITERRQMEEALRESEAALRQANDELLIINETLEERVAERTAELKERTVQLRALAGQLTQAEERERRRISQILHDHLQQLLVGARLHLQYLSARNKNEPLHQMLLKVESLIVESINTGRLLTAELSPMVLYQFGLGAALKWLGQWSAEKYGLTVQVDTEPEAEVEAEEVRVTLYQSVRELLFNVTKHAQVKSARVSLSRLHNGTIRIAVSDEGIGFDPLKVRSNEGTVGGFGLFSLRERLELFGAVLEIESEPGGGSRFSIMVPPSAAAPLTTPSPALSTPRASLQSVADGPKIRIVLADDHMVVLDGLKRALNDEPDFEVLGQATNGLQAVEMARRLQPDVILMDVAMPVMNGIEATRQVTAELPRIKVIGLSMYDDEPHAEAMFQVGAVDFLDKNGPFNEVVAAIRKHVGANH